MAIGRISTLPGGVMILTGALALASRIASVVSAMARSKVALGAPDHCAAGQGLRQSGSSRIASLMSASAPSNRRARVSKSRGPARKRRRRPGLID